jgi:hypothetical protein
MKIFIQLDYSLHKEMSSILNVKDRLCGSWLQIRRSRVRFPALQKKVVGLERDPLSLVSATEELLGRKSSGFGLEIREYGRRHSARWPRGTPTQKMLALTSLASGGRSVGIVRLRTEAMDFFNVKKIMYKVFQK